MWNVLDCPKRMHRSGTNGDGTSRCNWLIQVYLANPGFYLFIMISYTKYIEQKPGNLNHYLEG